MKWAKTIFFAAARDSAENLLLRSGSVMLTSVVGERSDCSQIQVERFAHATRRRCAAERWLGTPISLELLARRPSNMVLASRSQIRSAGRARGHPGPVPGLRVGAGCPAPWLVTSGGVAASAPRV